jgi:hypothetical protein
MQPRQAMLGALAAAVTLAAAALVLAIPAAADPPAAVPFEFTFVDVNPCTGLDHTVTIAGTTWVHEHDGRIVATSERTITTSPTGFVGHGTDTDVINGQVDAFRLTDILTNASGDRIRAHFVVVLDLSSGRTTFAGGEPTCLGPA